MKLTRPIHICEQILFVDGMSGTGKSMMIPFLASFDRVELGRFEHVYEHLCALDSMKKIDPDAAEYLTKMYADISLYHSMIARETLLMIIWAIRSPLLMVKGSFPQFIAITQISPL